MSDYGTPKERRDRYLESVRKTGGPMPTDDQIELITGYVPPLKRFGGWLVALGLGLLYAMISAFSE